MSKSILLPIVILVVLILSSCEKKPTYKEVDQTGLSLFPVPKRGFIGDPIPFFDGETFQVFYLHDARDGAVGFHPWYRLSTTNFFQYEDQGEMLPVVNKLGDQEQALGTGSVIEVNGVYHAFYTGHNPRPSNFPKEAIMHAVSYDQMDSWIKLPNDTFYASSRYNSNDFRDPHVVYIDEYKEYWMLITTRVGNRGVIARYTSTDLTNWVDQGIFFDNASSSGTADYTSNLECPTLLKFGNFWYLTFSDQWPTRVTHYRMSTSPNGPWITPKVDQFDGAGLYAGKIEKGFNRLFLFGWIPTIKSLDFEYDWAGNLVVHELRQTSTGELHAVPVKEVIEKLDNEQELTIVSKTVSGTNKELTFKGTGYETVVLKELQGISKITGTIKTGSNDDLFGLMFNVEGMTSSINIVFNRQAQRLEFYNVSATKFKSASPLLTMPLTIENNTDLHFTILTEGTSLTLYVNNESAFSTRMYNIQGYNWGIFALDSKLTVTNLTLSK